MLIVSQDRKNVVNMSQVLELEINSPDTWGQGFYSIDTYPLGEGNECHIRLGKYDTEERALEVLKDFLISYEAYELTYQKPNCDFGYTLADYTSIYYMPK